MKGEVLLTDGGDGRSRDCISAIRGLVQGGYRCVVASTRPGRGLSRYVSRTIEVPPVSDPAFAHTIEDLAVEFEVVVPASESCFRALFPRLVHLIDKRDLERAARAAGLEAPPTRYFPTAASLSANKGDLRYPVVIKPAVRTFNAFRAGSPADLRWLPPDAEDVLVQPFLTGTAEAVIGLVWREKIHSVVHERWIRKWPPDCGLASAAVTTGRDLTREHALRRLLTEHEGLFCAQFVDGFLIDLNLRVGSTHPLAVKAGVNLLAIYCDLVRGEDAKPRSAGPGYFFRWLEGDVRAIAHALRHGGSGWWEALDALRPRRGAAHSVESLKDPGPMVARLSYALGRAHLDADIRRAGSG